jgi:hypothetical protein
VKDRFCQRKNLLQALMSFSFLAETTIFPAKEKQEKQCRGGLGSVFNRKKVEGIDFKIDNSLLLH